MLQYLPLLLILAGWVLTPVLALWSLINALKTLAPAAFNPMVLRTVMRHKLAMIPVFLINYVFWMSPAALLNPWTFWLLPIAAIPLAVPIGLSMCSVYAAMLSSSVYVIIQVILLCRRKTLTWKQGIAGVILQLLPMVDTAHCVALRARHAPKHAPPENRA